MTTIQRFTPDYKMHAVRFEAFAREAEHGEYVKFDAHQRAVSALEAERDAQQKRADALAVENAALKAAGNKMFLSAISLMEDPDLKIDHSRDIKDWERNETPATDAAVREIEARGVEKFAEFLDSPIAGQHCYQNEVGLARHFASTLREAK